MRYLAILLAAVVPLVCLGCYEEAPPDCPTCPLTQTSQAAPENAGLYWSDPGEAIVLPGDKRWYLTVLTHDRWRDHAVDRLLMTWIYSDPALSSLRMQAEPRFYRPADSFYKRWEPFTKGQLPAICLQDPAGNRVYTAIYNGSLKRDSGSPIVPIPTTPAMLSDDLRAAIASWQGFVDKASPVAGGGEGPAYEIDRAGRLFFRNCGPRPCPDETPDEKPDDPDVTITDLDRLMSPQVNVQQQPPAARWTLPVWVPIVCGVAGLVIALVIGVLRRIQTESQN